VTCIAARLAHKIICYRSCGKRTRLGGAAAAPSGAAAARRATATRGMTHSAASINGSNNIITRAGATLRRCALSARA